MKKNILNLSLLACLATPLAAHAAPPAFVTTGANDGKGSLRAALASGASKIIITRKVKYIGITEPLVYQETAPLTLIGKGQTIFGHDGDGPILHVADGANLSVKHLDFAGPGGFDIEHPGGGKGIFVEVPDDREGLVHVQLKNVSVSGTGNHGIHVSDCSLGDECGDGQGEDEGTGSDASIFMQLNRVTVDGVGFGKQDADGVRIDDRGEGDIIFNATNSTFKDVGADGVELDEGGNGSVIINVRKSVFKRNGAYCFDIDGDGPFDPIAIDPNCNDDGDPDVDDAFDIDEAGPGGIMGMVANVKAIDNFDEGLDFDTEGDEGDNFVDLDLINIRAKGNADEGIKVSEEGNASVVVNMRAIKAGGDIEVEEEGDGDLQVSIKGSKIGDDLKLSESDDGVGTVKLRGTKVVDEKDFNNVDEI